MMGLLISQMLPCLLLAGLIGTIIGWLLRRCKVRPSQEGDRYLAESMDAPEPLLDHAIPVQAHKKNKKNKKGKNKSDAQVQRFSSDTSRTTTGIDDEVVQLRMKLSTAELAVKTSDMKMNALREEYDVKLQKAEESFYSRDSMLKSLENALEQEKAKVAAGNNKLSLLETEYQTKLEKVNSGTQEYDKRLRELEEKLAQKENASKSYEHEIDDLRSQLSRVETIKVQLEEEKQTIQKQYDTMQSDYNIKLKELADNAYEKEQKAKALELTLKEEKVAADKKISLMQSDYDFKLKEVSTSSKDNDRELQSLRDKLAHAELEVKGYETQVQTLKSDVSAKADLEKSLKTLRLELEEEKSASTKKYALLQSDYDTKLNDVTSSSKDAERELQSLRDKLAHAESEENTYKKELDRLKLALDESRISFEKKQAQMKSDYEFKVSEIASLSKEGDKELQSLKDKLAGAEKQLSNYESEIGTLKADVSASADLEKSLKALRLELEEEKSASTKKYALLQSDYDTKLNDVTSSSKDHEKELEALREKLSRAEFLAKESLNGSQEEITTLQAKLKEAENYAKESDNEAQALKADLREVKSSLTEAEALKTKNEELNKKMTIMQSDFDFKLQKSQLASKDIEGELDTLREKLSSVQSSSDKWKNEVEKLKAELTKKDSSANENNVELQALKAKFEEGGFARSEAKDLTAMLDGVKAELSDSKSQIKSLERDYDEQLEDAKTENQKLQIQLQALRANTSTVATGSSTPEKVVTATDAKKPTFLKKPNGKADNLQLIKGVGGKLSGVLNELGVYHFAQIASWTDTEVNWVNEHLSFAGRIEREEWIAQAKALMSGEETEFSARVKAGEVASSSHEEEEHENATMLRPQFLIQARNTGADNLQLIQGIGGSLSGELQDLGVYHYDQIAAWNPKEVAWMNQKLGLKGKIEKEDWIAQAKALAGGEPESEPTKRPKFLDKPIGGHADNLQLISGVGGKLNTMLNDLGVYHFSQIAAWDEEEVAWVNEHLSFTGRIQREEWIKQAKALMSGEETDFAKRVKSGEVASSEAKPKETLKRHKHTKRLKKK